MYELQRRSLSSRKPRDEYGGRMAHTFPLGSLFSGVDSAVEAEQSSRDRLEYPPEANTAGTKFPANATLFPGSIRRPTLSRRHPGPNNVVATDPTDPYKINTSEITLTFSSPLSTFSTSSARCGLAPHWSCETALLISRHVLKYR